MCQYQILSQSKQGYIVQCKECNRLQLAFGVAVVSMSREQFENLADFVAGEHSQFSLCDIYLKSTSISLGEHFMLYLSFNELEQLNDMFVEAAALLTTLLILEH